MKFYVRGLSDLQRKFDAVPDEVDRKVLRAGVSAGAKLVKAATKTNIRKLPRKRGPGTGTLERAVIINFRRKDSDSNQAVYIVTLRQGKKYQTRVSKKGRKIASSDAYYARFVEQGHYVRPPGKHLSRKGRLVNNRATAALKAGGLKKVPGYPFLQPALSANVDGVIRAMTDSVRENFAQIKP